MRDAGTACKTRRPRQQNRPRVSPYAHQRWMFLAVFLDVLEIIVNDKLCSNVGTVVVYLGRNQVIDV